MDTRPQLKVNRTFKSNKELTNDTWEGELEVDTEEEQDRLKRLIGDANAKVTISREISEKDFGNGGSLFVSVTLTVDQSHKGISEGVELAKYYAESTALAQFEDYQKELSRLLGKRNG